MPVKVGLKFIEKWGESMEKKILEYEQEEIIKNQIVFYGPSDFTRWAAYRGNTPIREALLGASGAKCCINRGFGSSTTEHHLYYYPRVIKPLEPKVLVYSLAAGNSFAFDYTVEEVCDLASRFLTYVKEDFPDIKICLLGINLYRCRLFSVRNTPKHEKVDEWIRNYAKENANCKYIDVANFEPLHREDVFEDDHVHYNNKGYVIFAELFKEALKEELSEF